MYTSPLLADPPLKGHNVILVIKGILTMYGNEAKTLTTLRNTLFPLFLILACPPTAIIIWYTNTALGGSLHALLALILKDGFFTTLYHIWKPVFLGTKAGWTIISVFMLTQLILMRVIPGKRFLGPITPTNHVPVYKSNGVFCYLITLALFYIGAYPCHFF